MSATGLEVFDKALQTTNIWLDERPLASRASAGKALEFCLRAHNTEARLCGRASELMQYTFHQSREITPVA